MTTPILERTRHIGVPFQGAFFLGDGFPMALPWAEREVPLAGRQIANHPENSHMWYEGLLDQSEAVVEADWRLPSPQPLGWCELGDEALKALARFPAGVESSGELRGEPPSGRGVEARQDSSL